MNHPLDQLAMLNDWLAEHEPDLYHSSESDTATDIINLLRRYQYDAEELRKALRHVQGLLGSGRIVGHDWQQAALNAENFIIDLLGAPGRAPLEENDGQTE
jgi:hypothetical protein